MNKGTWRLFTVLGFVVGIIAIGMILVLRFGFFDYLGSIVQTFGASTSTQTQELIDTLTLEVTQQRDQAASDADRKNLMRLQQSCFDSDCVSSIDKPKFVMVRQAKFMKDDDLVLGVPFDHWKNEDDPVKAYPLKILNWHEVVNDFVNGNPVVVTYSPLTGTPRVYSRLFDGKAVEFGVSEMVLNSNLVLVDRDTKSLWSQFDGVALVGSKRGTVLTPYPNSVQIVRWADWVSLFPSTVVLSGETGFAYSYEESPYGDYEKTQDIYFPLENTDGRRKSKEVVYGVLIGTQAKLYPELELQKALPASGTIADEFAGRKLTLSYSKKTLKVVDIQTKSEIPNIRSYYFAWEAFYPGSDIYQAPSAST